MDKRIQQRLKAAGREDLITAMEITELGYAGVMPNGNIVDRRKHPEAISIPKNAQLGIPEAKAIPPREVNVRFFKSMVARLMKDWKGGPKGEYLAMEWIAEKLREVYCITERPR